MKAKQGLAEEITLDTAVKKLEELNKRDWIFTLWLTGSGKWIVQGTIETPEDRGSVSDWDIDVKAEELLDAIDLALAEVPLLEARRNGN